MSENEQNKKVAENSNDDAEILKQSRKRYDDACSAWKDNKDQSLNDMEFQNGGAWHEKIRKEREDSNRPCLDIDLLSPAVAQVVNDTRKQNVAIKIKPADKDASQDIAEVLEGLIRNIESSSDAESAYDTGVTHSAQGGMGFWRIITRFENGFGFNQELAIKRIKNPLSVTLDPMFQNADGSDIGYAFIEEDRDRKDLQAQYPDADISDWESCQGYDGNEKHWFKQDTIRVAEYYRKTFKPRTRILIKQTDLAAIDENGDLFQELDGRDMWKEDFEEDEVLQELVKLGAIEVADTRKVNETVVEWFKMTGNEILERTEWAGTMIPVVPCFGSELNVGDKTVYYSVIRRAKDSQRAYNYGRSAAVEGLSLAPKVPWVMTAGQMEGYKSEWGSANSSNASVLPYNHIDGVPAPQRVAPATVQAGYSNEALQASSDIKSTTGIFDAKLGARSNETSGIAIQKRQEEGENATFNFGDNQRRAIRLTGLILLDAMPRIYDADRVVQILNADNQPEEVIINRVFEDEETGEPKENDFTLGSYTVVVDAGSSLKTKRQETQQVLLELMQAMPNAAPVIADLAVREMDFKGAEEIANRLKSLVPPEVIAAGEGKEASPQAGIDPATGLPLENVDELTSELPLG